MVVVSVLSGGLDSTILLHSIKKDMKYDVLALSFNYGQRHVYELEKAKETCAELEVPHKIINIDFFGDIVAPVSSLSAGDKVAVPTIEEVLGHPQPSTYVPFRNLMLTSIALAFAESNNAKGVYLGLQSHDLYSYWDTSPQFVDIMNDLTLLNRMHSIPLVAPFVHMSKKEEIEIGVRLGVDFTRTWTCYAGPNEKGEACGVCPSCAERIGNFKYAGVKDPIPYAISIDWT